MRAIVFALFLFIPTYSFADDRYGSFLSPLDLRSVPAQKHRFELLADFSFRDRTGRLWTAPKGITVDGASIPRSLWTIVGSPWAGLYKEASVIHDHFCVKKGRSWQDVHRVFYDAMLANGVDPIAAKVMYAAVYRFGPRWSNPEENFKACAAAVAKRKSVKIGEIDGECFKTFEGVGRVVWDPDFMTTELKDLETLARAGKSVEEIEHLARRQIASEPVYNLLAKHGLAE